MGGCHHLGTRDWCLMHYSNPVITGGQKHTHNLLHSNLISNKVAFRVSTAVRAHISLFAAFFDSTALDVDCWYICIPLSPIAHLAPGYCFSFSIEFRYRRSFADIFLMNIVLMYSILAGVQQHMSLLYIQSADEYCVLPLPPPHILVIFLR
jgi:hypothetical protein